MLREVVYVCRVSSDMTNECEYKIIMNGYEHVQEKTKKQRKRLPGPSLEFLSLKLKRIN